MTVSFMVNNVNPVLARDRSHIKQPMRHAFRDFGLRRQPSAEAAPRASSKKRRSSAFIATVPDSPALRGGKTQVLAKPRKLGTSAALSSSIRRKLSR